MTTKRRERYFEKFDSFPKAVGYLKCDKSRVDIFAIINLTPRRSESWYLIPRLDEMPGLSNYDVFGAN